jgi:hypothetical protein
MSLRVVHLAAPIAHYMDVAFATGVIGVLPLVGTYHESVLKTYRPSYELDNNFALTDFNTASLRCPCDFHSYVQTGGT